MYGSIFILTRVLIRMVKSTRLYASSRSKATTIVSPLFFRRRHRHQKPVQLRLPNG